MDEMKVSSPNVLLGFVLAQIRKDKGLAQTDLAKAVGIGPSSWSRVEKGETPISLDQLKLAAEALGMSRAEILELVDKLEDAALKEGIQMDPKLMSSILRGTGTASVLTSALVGSSIGAVLPVVGPVVGALVGGAFAALWANKKQEE